MVFVDIGVVRARVGAWLVISVARAGVTVTCRATNWASIVTFETQYQTKGASGHETRKMLL